MNEHRFASREEFEAYNRRLRAIEYETHSQPIIHKMVELKSMFSSPWMIVNNGVVVDSGERWTDKAAEALYQKYEHTLELLKRCICGEGDLTPPNAAPKSE